MSQSIYLDNAATTPLLAEVWQYMQQRYEISWANPSSTHAMGRKAKTEIEQARRSIAKWLNCAPNQLYFTSGGTESDNIVLQNAAHLKRSCIITTTIEHHAVLHAATNQELPVIYTPLLADGELDLQALEHLLAQNPNALVSIMHINNELGNINPIEKIAKLCRKYEALLHTDTTQSVGMLPIDLKAWDVDFAVGSAHKFNGPKGIGFLYVKPGIFLKPIMHGGAQEKELRSGTENVLGIIGMAYALQLAYTSNRAAHVLELKEHMRKKLLEIQGTKINGSEASAPHILNCNFAPTSIDTMLLFNLDLQGICASGGSACSSGAAKGSHVLDAVYPNSTGSNVRFSFGVQNTLQEIDSACEIIKELIEQNA